MTTADVVAAVSRRRQAIRSSLPLASTLVLAALAAGPASAQGASAEGALPDPPPSGEMGFVVNRFIPPIVPGFDACPEGTALKVRDSYIAGLEPAERERLLKSGNEEELESAWRASGFGPNGTNLCTHPDMFDRPPLRTVQNDKAYGLDLDGGAAENTCEQEDFTSPTGQTGIDNQEYRALGCTLEWRGNDGEGGSSQSAPSSSTDRANGLRSSCCAESTASKTMIMSRSSTAIRRMFRPSTMTAISCPVRPSLSATLRRAIATRCEAASKTAF